MKKFSDRKNSYNYEGSKLNYYKKNKTKIANYNNKKNKIYDNCQIENDNYQIDRQNNENENSILYLDIDNCKYFYPKNQYLNENVFNNLYNISSKVNNEFFANNNLLINNYFSKKENESKALEEKNVLSIEQQSKNKMDNKLIEEKKEIKDKIKKAKKIGIKSIPHPKKIKNEQDGSYKIDKNLFSIIGTKRNKDYNNIKKERQLSVSPSQNNFDSAKHSISTLNTSSSSHQEKCDINEENNTVNNNKNIEITNDKKALKKIFDDKNAINQYQAINPNLENTEVLEVNVKISENQIVSFKIKRFDDLFYTILLFCEINSINEKLIKPLIIQSLRALNTIYQIYNCKLSSEDIYYLEKIEKIYNYV